MPEVSDVTFSIESEVKFITKDNFRIGEPALFQNASSSRIAWGEKLLQN